MLIKRAAQIIPFMFVLLATTNAHAGCVGSVVMGKCHGQMIDGVNEETPSYESNSGASYQYNLSDPSDRNDYSTDLDAQRRDQMSTDPRTGLDKNTGQYGGGVYE